MSGNIFGGQPRVLEPEVAQSDAHPHFAHVYESQREQFATVVSFIRTGVEQGERCVYLYDDNDRDELVAALKAGGVPVESALEDGRLTFRPAKEVYLNDGEFDHEGMLATLEKFIEETAASDEYERLRVTGENSYLADCELSIERFFEYEAAVNLVFGEDNFVGLCQFPRDRFDDDVLADIIRTHPQMAFDGCSLPNDYFEQPDEFNAGQGGAHVDDRLTTLRRQTELAQTASDYRSVATELSNIPSLPDGPSETAIVDPGVDLFQSVLDVPAAGFWLYDTTTQTLDLSATVTDGTLQRNAEDLFAEFTEYSWEAFAENEPQVHQVGDRSDLPVESLLLAPVEDYGVLVAAGTTETFENRKFDIAMAVKEQVSTSLDSVQQERELRNKERALKERTESLTHLNEIHETTCGIATKMLEASTIEGAQELICDELTDSPLFRFAWIGEYDRVNEKIEPVTWAGIGRGYLDSVPLAIDESCSEPAVGAVRRKEPVTTMDVVTQLHEEAWRQEALARKFRAIAAVPLVYDDIQYGVLAVYAHESDALDEPVPSVLSELGKLIAYIFNAIERKKSLLTDRTIRLTFEFQDSQSPIFRIAREAGCELELEGVVPKSRQGMLGFFSVSGGSIDAFVDAADDAVAVQDYRIIEKDSEGAFVQLGLKPPFIATTLVEHGVMLESMTADESVARVEVAFPDSIDIRTVAQVMSNTVSDSELVSKSEKNQPTPFDADGDSPMKELTDRQLEILQTAYHAGYFEKPRQCDGQAVADMLDISPPTFHQHRRLGIRGILRSLLDD